MPNATPNVNKAEVVFITINNIAIANLSFPRTIL